MAKTQANGIQLYYEIHGQGQPLLFIHGLGSSARDWEFQVAEFARTYQVIVLDLRGHGKSDKPAGPYSMALFAQDIAELLKALGISQAHVVGLSLGGGIAFQLAVAAPATLKTLTIVNSAPEMVVRTWQERLALWQRLAIVRVVGMKKMGEVLSKRLFVKPEEEALRQTFVERWAENDKRAYLDSLRALVGWSVTAQLGNIRCPTLVLAAEHDYTPVSVKEAYVARMSDAQLVVIPDAHHALPVEKPRAFNQALQEFLARHP
ncbi:alpha/beta fold hydrolase [Anaerolineae bacterium CFX7]|nr:alpha/beta fold hydrolase [Anaerolineae bacterium CFX7]